VTPSRGAASARALLLTLMLMTGCGDGGDVLDPPLPPSMGTSGGAGSTAGVAICAGNLHTCVITEGGQVACAGLGLDGQLGSAEHRTRRSFAPVPGVEGATSLACGSRHTCVTTRAGALFCWGEAASEQLGVEDATLGPVQVPGVTGAVQVAAGDAFTCVRTREREVYCLGALPEPEQESTPSGEAPADDGEVLANPRRCKAWSTSPPGAATCACCWKTARCAVAATTARASWASRPPAPRAGPRRASRAWWTWRPAARSRVAGCAKVASSAASARLTGPAGGRHALGGQLHPRARERGARRPRAVHRQHARVRHRGRGPHAHLLGRELGGPPRLAHRGRPGAHRGARPRGRHPRGHRGRTQLRHHARREPVVLGALARGPAGHLGLRPRAHRPPHRGAA
jgi:hypothetical protein